MMTKRTQKSDIDTNTCGFLTSGSEWTRDTGCALAEKENIRLTEQHWMVVELFRYYYQEYLLAPAWAYALEKIGESQNVSMDEAQRLIQELFPHDPAGQIWRIAGLPSTTGCE